MRRLLLLLCLFAHLAAAQPLPARQFLRQFGAAEGLSQPFIYALAQDSAGYLWLGTAEGLVRFDGTNFQTFTTREGLAEDFVTRLAVEPGTGRLWVGHYQSGFSVSQGRAFRRAGAAETRLLSVAKGLPAPDTARIGQFRRRYQPALPPQTVISAVLRDAEGAYWLATAGAGLWRLTDPHITLFATSKRLSALAGNAPGSIMAGTAAGQLLRIEASVAGLALQSLAAPAASGPITVLLPAGPLYGTETNGVRPYLAGSASPRQPGSSYDPAVLAALPGRLHVTTLARDTAGGLWVGTLGDGAFYLRAGRLRHYTTATGLLHNDVYAVLTDRQGRVWFASHGTGLAVLETGGEFRSYRLLPGGIDATALAQDATGRVWVGTEGDGLFCFEQGRFRQFTARNSGLASNYCYGLLPTPAGLLVQHRNALSLGRGHGFRPLTTPGNPLVQELLPNAMALLPGPQPAAVLASRPGLLRVALSRWPATTHTAVSVTAVEVDGARRDPGTLPELAARPHHLTWFFRAASLAPAGTWQYQYRLRGYQPQWSRPSSLAEADFPHLEAGNYQFEVRARRGAEDHWGAVAAAPLRIATPFWQTAWFAVLSVAAVAGGVWGFTRARTATLRRQKLRLEATVQERTAELRQQKAETEQTNADLVVARDAAEASRRAKAQFLANMSHEIRTPMNAVIGLSHLLRNTPINGEQQEYLEAIQSSSQNLLVIINDILDSSKMEAGKLTLEQAPFRLPALVERIGRMFRFATEAKGLYFHTEISPEVPAAILGDPVRLNQVLVNLVGNAVKFTTRGGITLRVELVAPAGPEAAAGLRFGIRDTGIGIAADKLDSIFEDFSQANASTTRQYGGTGLGLSIARNLVQLHGGRLWVESEEGAGSTFWFEIPARPADPATVPPEAALVLPPFEPPLRVLVAEDNLLNQLVARKTLEAWNVRVTLADNGRLAVEAAQQQVFDAVLLDVQMPEMDGYEAARQLRALFPDPQRLPLIGLTASALPEDRVLALAAGMNDTLAKPFDPAVLYARLAHYTGRTPADAPTSAPSPATAPALAQPAPGPSEAPGPEAPGPEAPDWTLLEELAGGNEAFICQIIATFLAQAPQMAEQLRLPADAALSQVAHKLRGQAAYFGLEQLGLLLETVEQQARLTPAGPDLADQLADIHRRLHHVYPLLEQRLLISSTPG
ncbi:hypothetical protein CDA63_12975 [Hymenobacter amundsenii]|uniref:histidine kinase n=1 Tax=Hymenobacter amundsenii TaxID=2006685 RepID=A0A246FJE5_9BACT|nr:hybrid sensor histidine kinase/response regulator [Hymenobacter amundsenii]OWP62681.1 hypothetical protein CDA63_12975 [Hymenobacter amundsenii]